MQFEIFDVINQDTSSKSVDVLLYGSIPAYDWDNDTVKNKAEQFVAEFKALENDYDRINIHINSPGGSMVHGIPMFNAIASSEKEVHTYNDGIAASMAAVILLAGKTVHVAKNSLIMVHPASIYGRVNSKSLAEISQTLQAFDSIIINAIMDKTGLSEDEVTNRYMNGGDVWIKAQDAATAKMVDVVEDYAAEKLPKNGQVTNLSYMEVVNAFESENKEEGIMTKIVAMVEKAVSRITKQQPIEENSEMDFKNSLGILEKENPTKEELATVKAEIKAFTGASEKFTTEEVNARINAAVTQAKEDAEKPLKDSINAKDTEISNLKAEIERLKNADGAGAQGGGQDSGDGNDGEYKRENFAHNRLVDEQLKNF